MKKHATPSPANCVWYVEVRLRTPGDMFAVADPDAVGSAVAVALEIPAEAALVGRTRRTYSLTAAHLVSTAGDESVGEIVCFPPGGGYVRTGQGTRRIGTFDFSQACIARVSKLSPGGAESRPDELRHALHDWALLEIARPDFQAAEVADWGHCDVLDLPLTIFGYPGGAGRQADVRQATDPEAVVHFWESGKVVRPVESRGFRSSDLDHRGMLGSTGGDSRPGMSGGGVFTREGKLVAIHRHAVDESMERGAVSADWIRQWLSKHRNVAFPEAIAPTRKGPHRVNAVATTAMVAFVLVCLGVAALAFNYEPQQVVEEGYVTYNGTQDRIVPIGLARWVNDACRPDSLAAITVTQMIETTLASVQAKCKTGTGLLGRVEAVQQGFDSLREARAASSSADVVRIGVEHGARHVVYLLRKVQSAVPAVTAEDPRPLGTIVIIESVARRSVLEEVMKQLRGVPAVKVEDRPLHFEWIDQSSEIGKLKPVAVIAHWHTLRSDTSTSEDLGAEERLLVGFNEVCLASPETVFVVYSSAFAKQSASSARAVLRSAVSRVRKQRALSPGATNFVRSVELLSWSSPPTDNEKSRLLEAVRAIVASRTGARRLLPEDRGTSHCLFPPSLTPGT